jgi:hypothetical protein
MIITLQLYIYMGYPPNNIPGNTDNLAYNTATHQWISMPIQVVLSPPSPTSIMTPFYK